MSGLGMSALRLVRDRYSEMDFTIRQLAMLTVLADEMCEPTIKGVGDYLNLPRKTVSGLVSKFVSNGIVGPLKTRPGGEGTPVVIEITEYGRRLSRRMG